MHCSPDPTDCPSTGTANSPTASPFTRAQPAALSCALASLAILPPSLTFLACSLDRCGHGRFMTFGTRDTGVRYCDETHAV